MHSTSEGELRFWQYRSVPGCPEFVVDGFTAKYTSQCDFFFLTHYHADHYVGLSRTFRRGTIVASTITCRLLVQHLGLDPTTLRRLDPGESIHVKEGVIVTALESHHCLGSVMFLFRATRNHGTTTTLHTGDLHCTRTTLPGMEASLRRALNTPLGYRPYVDHLILDGASIPSNLEENWGAYLVRMHLDPWLLAHPEGKRLFVGIGGHALEGAEGWAYLRTQWRPSCCDVEWRADPDCLATYVASGVCSEWIRSASQSWQHPLPLSDTEDPLPPLEPEDNTTHSRQMVVSMWPTRRLIQARFDVDRGGTVKWEGQIFDYVICVVREGWASRWMREQQRCRREEEHTTQVQWVLLPQRYVFFPSSRCSDSRLMCE